MIKRTFVAVAVSLAAGLVLADQLLPLAHEKARATERMSGAYRAMNFWTAARAYPEADLPPAAYRRAVETQAPPAFVRERGAPGWEAIGPWNQAGRALSIAIDPTDPQTIYVGTAGGGLWRSTTAGVGAAAWQHLPTGFPIHSVSTVELDPNDAQTIYIGTGEVYNYDGAGTGQAIRATRGTYGIGILKSIDGGATWSKSLDWGYAQEHGVWKIEVHPQNSAIVWAATTEGTYKSIDAGATWTLVHPVVMAMDLVIHPSDPDFAIVGCGNLGSVGHGIYRTVDGGVTWTKASGGGVPVAFGGKVALDLHEASPNIVYASIGNSASSNTSATWLLRSVDGGVTWFLRSGLDYSKYQGWYSHDVSIHPNDSNELVVVGVDAFHSTDGGATLGQTSVWTGWYTGAIPPGAPEGSTDYVHADIHDVQRVPGAPDVVYYATDGGVFRSLDGGLSFESCNGGLQTTQFYGGFSSSTTNPALALGGLQDNATAIYQGSTTWYRLVIGGDGSWTAIDPSNENVLWGSYYYLNLAKSLDGGLSWAYDQGPLAAANTTVFIAPFVLAPSAPTWMYGGRDIVYRTTNAGATWAATNLGSPLNGDPVLCMAISSQDHQRVYAATTPIATRMEVFRTDDGGNTWVNVTGSLPDRYPGDLHVDPQDDDRLLLTLLGFGTSHVFLSEDAGATWQDVGSGLPDLPTGAAAIDPDVGSWLYVGNDLGVYASLDNGATWQSWQDGMDEAALVYDLSVSSSDRTIRVVTHGRGVFERSLPSAVASTPYAASRVRLEQNAPNPFNPSTTIAFELPQAGRARLTIHDVRGRRVRTLYDEFAEAGERSVVWDGRDDGGIAVASGVYSYRLETAAGVLTKRMTLLK